VLVHRLMGYLMRCVGSRRFVAASLNIALDLLQMLNFMREPIRVALRSELIALCLHSSIEPKELPLHEWVSDDHDRDRDRGVHRGYDGVFAVPEQFRKAFFSSSSSQDRCELRQLIAKSSPAYAKALRLKRVVPQDDFEQNCQLLGNESIVTCLLRADKFDSHIQFKGIQVHGRDFERSKKGRASRTSVFKMQIDGQVRFGELLFFVRVPVDDTVVLLTRVMPFRAPH